jgi:hypothetical protein
VFDVPVRAILAGFGVLVLALMAAIMRWHGGRAREASLAGQRR